MAPDVPKYQEFPGFLASLAFMTVQRNSARHLAHNGVVAGSSPAGPTIRISEAFVFSDFWAIWLPVTLG
jgi:hypothetical protein